MQKFRQNGTGGFIRNGLWKYSRHPNYLGEILMWWGVGLAAVCAMPAKWYLLAGAVANTLLFLCISIPLADGTGKTCDIVVTSFDTSLTYEKLDNACRMVRNGAEYLSTHPDFNCPTEDGFIPDSGAIAAFVTASTGKVPTYFGKPYAETVQMIEEATGVAREDMCIFGDRLYTDIALGKKHGVCSVLVLSGETTKADVESADVCDRPDYVFPSLREVDEAMFGGSYGI